MGLSYITRRVVRGGSWNNNNNNCRVANRNRNNADNRNNNIGFRVARYCPLCPPMLSPMTVAMAKGCSVGGLLRTDQSCVAKLTGASVSGVSTSSIQSFKLKDKYIDLKSGKESAGSSVQQWNAAFLYFIKKDQKTSEVLKTSEVSEVDSITTYAS